MDMRWSGVFAAMIFLSGCAGISKEECLYADWEAIGYEDGAAGRPVSAVSSRRAVCAKKAGVTVDMTSYRAGREEGLAVFCTPSNGYTIGSNGGRYRGVCTGPVEADFVSAFEAGRQLYNLEHAVSSISAQITQAQYDLHEIENRIAHTEISLIAPHTPGVERVHLLVELKQLSEEKGSIETALIALNRDHVRAQGELADYREFIAYNGPYPQPATSASQASY